MYSSPTPAVCAVANIELAALHESDSRSHFVDGFSLHAGVRIEAEDHVGLEHLLHYCALVAPPGHHALHRGPGAHHPHPGAFETINKLNRILRPPPRPVLPISRLVTASSFTPASGKLQDKSYQIYNPLKCSSESLGEDEGVTIARIVPPAEHTPTLLRVGPVMQSPQP